MKRLWLGLILVLATGLLIARPTDPTVLWKEFVGNHGDQWRTHRTGRGTLRSMYGKSTISGGTVEQAAQSFLRDAAGILDIDSVRDLRLASIDREADGADLRYAQYYGGFPVAGAEVTLHLDRRHRAVAATSSYRSGLLQAGGSIVPVAVAQETALRFLRNSEAAPSGLWIVPVAGVARPAWRFHVASRDPDGGSYLLYVDAANPSVILRVFRTRAEAEGQGSVYRENPVVTPDRTTEKFLNMDSTTSLSGKFVKTYNANFEYWYSSALDPSVYTTASDANRQYNYETGDARFAEAMAYFHTNRVHDHWRSLGFSKLNVRFPVFVNVVTSTGEGLDNAYYRRYSTFSRFGVIVMGAGDDLQNFGWDSDVYYHEYGHAVLDRLKPGFFEVYETNYSAAFHEGFSDISAAAITGNSQLAEYALREKATQKFVGRDANNKNRYPEDVPLPGYGISESHHTGLIIAGAWWDLQKSIGRPAAQKILLRSTAMIPDDMSFFDVRDAMLTSDARLNGGANSDEIAEAFRLHGLDGEEPLQTGTVTVTALKTATYIVKDGRLVWQFKNSFKRGDSIFIFANYRGANLVPGYNLIGEQVTLTGPAEPQVDYYGDFWEVGNGNHTAARGALVGDVFTYEGSRPGKYTVTVATRLGRSQTLLPARKVSFQLK